MFSFIKKMFGRDGGVEPMPEASAMIATPTVTPKPADKPEKVERPAASGVEVASLSLRVILEKLPPELKPIVNQLPGPEVKIVLPVNTIVKQLASGNVRMSLASLLRQAPPGTFRKASIEEKQMVDVPLSEVFKCVDARRLGRRVDQRRYDVPDEATGLFGKDGTTRSVSDANAESAPKADSGIRPAKPAVDRNVEPKVIHMPGVSPNTPKPDSDSIPDTLFSRKSDGAPAAAAKPEAPKPAGDFAPKGDVILSFVELAAGWPEGVRNEFASIPGDTKLVIPASAVGPGLQKGKVVFQWAQVSRWMSPQPAANIAIADDVELVFPLKIVAPAFVASAGAAKRREGAEVDRSLPDFFGPNAGQPKQEAPAAPAAVAPAPVAAAAPPEPEVDAEEIEVAPPMQFSLVSEPAAPAIDSAVAEPNEVIEVPAGTSLSPSEVVKRVCECSSVAGAVVGLEEGLVVAQILPEGLVADAIAAFMPQVFGKLERYAEEMKLGAMSEVTLQAETGLCHISRSGKIYLGVISRAGQKLPEGLGQLSKQLAAHTN